MIFPPRPKGIERDQTAHGRLYYTSEDLRRYGLQCVEEYKRCNPERSKESVNPLSQRSSMSDAVNDLFSKMGVKSGPRM